jgi:hypothetical protein
MFYKAKQLVVGGCQIWAVRRIVKNSPSNFCDLVTCAQGGVRPRIVVKEKGVFHASVRRIVRMFSQFVIYLHCCELAWVWIVQAFLLSWKMTPYFQRRAWMGIIRSVQIKPVRTILRATEYRPSETDPLDTPLMHQPIDHFCCWNPSKIPEITFSSDHNLRPFGTFFSEINTQILHSDSFETHGHVPTLTVT